MKLISVCGIDKSGKTTIIKRINEITNKNHIIADRDASAYDFFNHLLDRIENKSEYEKEYREKQIQFRTITNLAIFLTVSKKDWLVRCKEHNEQKLVGDLSFTKHQNALLKNFNNMKYPNVLKLNTSKLTEDECMSLILKRLGIHKEKINANK